MQAHIQDNIKTGLTDARWEGVNRMHIDTHTCQSVCFQQTAKLVQSSSETPHTPDDYWQVSTYCVCVCKKLTLGTLQDLT
jgi:hypothetical protein